MIMSKWMYASAVYNSIIFDYKSLDQKPDFGALQESINTIVRAVEDALTRLIKLDLIADQVFVGLGLMQARIQDRAASFFPELNQSVLKNMILLLEIIFCNTLIFKSILCQTGVTKSLELAIEMVRLAEKKWGQLNVAMIQSMNPELGQRVLHLKETGRIYYNVSMLLICYLINKIELDYSLSQVRTKKQLHQENYLLGCELHRWLTDRQLNKFGPDFDPLVAVLYKKFVAPAYVEAEKYRATELHNLKDQTLLNVSLHTITSRYDRIQVQGDMVKESVLSKAGLLDFKF